MNRLGLLALVAGFVACTPGFRDPAEEMPGDAAPADSGLAHSRSDGGARMAQGSLACAPIRDFELCPNALRDGSGEVAAAGDDLSSSFHGAQHRKLISAPELPTLSTRSPIIDAMWRLAIEEIASLRRQESFEGRAIVRFAAGDLWPQAWARDTSYSIDFGLAFIFPQETRDSLDVSVERADGRRRVRQDSTLHFGSWPNLTDGIVWAIGAFEWRRAQGGDTRADEEVIHDTIVRAESEIIDSQTGLFRGVASFMESNSAYPQRYAWPINFLDPFRGDIGKTQALSTNLLYAQAYEILATLAESRGDSMGAQSERGYGARLRQNIESELTDGHGAYAYFVDDHGAVDRNRFEGLGNLLACRIGIKSDCHHIREKVEVSTFGAPCLWPQYPEWVSWEASWDASPQLGLEYNFYHNGMVWPFVEAYAGWMAARDRDGDALLASFARMIRLAGQDLTFREYHHPADGRGGGSRRQLWSAAGYVGLVLRGLLGIEAQADRLMFRPLVPPALGGMVQVRGLKYRGATVDVTVHGAGSSVRSTRLDGAPLDEAAVPATLSGSHSLELDL